MILFFVFLFILFYCAVGVFCGACMAACVFTDWGNRFKWPSGGEWFLGLFFFTVMFTTWPMFLLMIVPIEYFGNLNSKTKVYMTLDCYKDLKIVVNHLGGSFHRLREIL